MEVLYASHIMADTLRMQQLAADLDSSVVSPITVWMAPVAKKRRLTNNCNNGGTGLLRCILVAMSGMICKIYKIVAGLKSEHDIVLRKFCNLHEYEHHLKARLEHGI